jgi:ceramide glucosyltransferase
LGAVVGALSSRPVLAASLLGWALLNRVVMSITAGYGVVGDQRALRDCWLYPVRDLMGFFFWFGSYFGDTIDWRGEKYRLVKNGKMLKVGGESTAKESTSVAVDNLS